MLYRSTLCILIYAWNSFPARGYCIRLVCVSRAVFCVALWSSTRFPWIRPNAAGSVTWLTWSRSLTHKRPPSSSTTRRTRVGRCTALSTCAPSWQSLSATRCRSSPTRSTLISWVFLTHVVSTSGTFCCRAAFITSHIFLLQRCLHQVKRCRHATINDRFVLGKHGTHIVLLSGFPRARIFPDGDSNYFCAHPLLWWSHQEV